MDYTANSLKLYEAACSTEKLTDHLLVFYGRLWCLVYYFSPIILPILYHYGYLLFWLKLAGCFVLIAFLTQCVRGCGRMKSASYARLVKALRLTRSPRTAEEGKKALRALDFDFNWWPVDFDVREVLKSNDKKLRHKFNVEENPYPIALNTLLIHIGAYLAVKTFGLRLLYPGSIPVLKKYMKTALIRGRAQLITERKANRFKVKTIDRNEIDTAFIDNRMKSANGETLIICSEGNLGFYEIGTLATPLGRKYSLLGWNHPGYGNSTGVPYPGQEQNAIDAVIRFAIHRLNFLEEQIILYGWSIGGYSALCGAVRCERIKGVILDGTFDDVLFLARRRMPHFSGPLVDVAVRKHCNLNNAALIKHYQGPILLIRRTFDETIGISSQLETNRGNYLALALLQYRYPNIFQEAQLMWLESLLGTRSDYLNDRFEGDQECEARLVAYVAKAGKSFPLQIGEDYSEEERDQMVRFLLKKHLRDFQSSHCPRLPMEYFQVPWRIPEKRISSSSR